MTARSQPSRHRDKLRDVLSLRIRDDDARAAVRRVKSTLEASDLPNAATNPRRADTDGDTTDDATEAADSQDERDPLRYEAVGRLTITCAREFIAESWRYTFDHHLPMRRPERVALLPGRPDVSCVVPLERWSLPVSTF